jgi:hypothetical protein
VHAELRINAEGIWIIEVAARTIGGECARLLELATGRSLESLVIRAALQMPVSIEPPRGGAGVLMIPTPRAGVLRRIEGVLAAQKVSCIEELVISIREGHELVPLPEGASYLGFMYACAPSAQQAEAALRAAYAELNIVVAPLWKITAPPVGG